MSGMIQPDYGARIYGIPTKAHEENRAGTQRNRFLDMLARAAGRDTTDVLEISSSPTETTSVDTYMNHLKNKYGRVTIESIGKDQASLQKAGRHMSGNDVVIAPNILENMVHDPKKAVYYEQKIDYFFTDVIPNGKAYAASIGLTFEPCGVIVHEDGTVTYICGGGDPPERVAEVNKIHRETDAKKAVQQRQYQEQAAAVAAEHRAIWERIVQAEALEKSFSNIGDLRKARMVSAPVVLPEISLPTGINMFFLNL